MYVIRSSNHTFDFEPMRSREMLQASSLSIPIRYLSVSLTTILDTILVYAVPLAH